MHQSSSSSTSFRSSSPSPPSSPSSSSSQEDISITHGRLHYLSQPLKSYPPLRQRAQRFNDGACDSRGRFFAGTLEAWDEEGCYWGGQLWCFDPESGKSVLIDDDIKVCRIASNLWYDWPEDWCNCCRKAMGLDGVQMRKQCKLFSCFFPSIY